MCDGRNGMWMPMAASVFTDRLFGLTDGMGRAMGAIEAKDEVKEEPSENPLPAHAVRGAARGIENMELEAAGATGIARGTCGHVLSTPVESRVAPCPACARPVNPPEQPGPDAHPALTDMLNDSKESVNELLPGTLEAREGERMVARGDRSDFGATYRALRELL